MQSKSYELNVLKLFNTFFHDKEEGTILVFFVYNVWCNN